MSLNDYILEAKEPFKKYENGRVIRGSHKWVNYILEGTNVVEFACKDTFEDDLENIGDCTKIEGDIYSIKFKKPVEDYNLSINRRFNVLEIDCGNVKNLTLRVTHTKELKNLNILRGGQTNVNILFIDKNPSIKSCKIVANDLCFGSQGSEIDKKMYKLVYNNNDISIHNIEFTDKIRSIVIPLEKDFKDCKAVVFLDYPGTGDEAIRLFKTFKSGRVGRAEDITKNLQFTLMAKKQPHQRVFALYD